MLKRRAMPLESFDYDVATLQLDASHLSKIDVALRANTRLPPLPDFLAEQYYEFQLDERRYHNRLSIIVMSILFDSFLFLQDHTAPEIANLSAILRLIVLSPLVFTFIILDLRGKLHEAYSQYIILLAVVPTLISDILILLTSANDTQSLSDIRATPLILMATGVVMRLTPREVTINATISITSFTAAVLCAACVPPLQEGPLIFSEIGVAVGAIMLNIQLESRDRRVFLLRISAAINRAALAARNRFLFEDSQTDGLTGVPNRRCFDKVLADAVRNACAGGDNLGLIIIDIDHFKLFNDHYGHQKGDDCLRVVATRASQEIRNGDLFARYGGEEFAVILPATTFEATVAVAERIRAEIFALQLPHQGLGDKARVTVSLGVAIIRPKTEADSRRLIEVADVNLYAAKRAGRNRVWSTFSPTVESNSPADREPYKA